MVLCRLFVFNILYVSVLVLLPLPLFGNRLCDSGQVFDEDTNSCLDCGPCDQGYTLKICGLQSWICCPDAHNHNTIKENGNLICKLFRRKNKDDIQGMMVTKPTDLKESSELKYSDSELKSTDLPVLSQTTSEPENRNIAGSIMRPNHCLPLLGLLLLLLFLKIVRD